MHRHVWDDTGWSFTASPYAGRRHKSGITRIKQRCTVTGCTKTRVTEYGGYSPPPVADGKRWAPVLPLSLKQEGLPS